MSRLRFVHRKSAGGRLQTVRSRRPSFETLEPRRVLDAGPLVISEFLAINDSGLADTDGDHSDWIEVYNPTGNTVDLAGWHLTDDPADLAKWTFPSKLLGSGQYLVVFASGKDRTDPAQLHTNFQLDGAGEYLALVRPDGVTVSYCFSPQYPQQYPDASYGVTQDDSAFALEATSLAYLVPSSADAALGTDWTTTGFDDASWGRFSLPPQVLITEAGTEDDFVEIQNLSGKSIDTSGWVVAVNYPRGTVPYINNRNTILWELPNEMAPDQVLYRHDDAADPDHYWGEGIVWSTTGNGWAMIVDDAGEVVDFAVWGYTSADIAAMTLEINGFEVHGADAWVGDGAARAAGPSLSLQRSGEADHDDASDLAFVGPVTRGESNAELVAPFPTPGTPSLGFDLNPPDFEGQIVVDVAEAMHGVNASAWIRIPFEVEEVSSLESMALRMKYNDGFVAYLNGHEVARQNAPPTVQWDSSAPATRSVEDSQEFQLFDISESLGVLQTGTNVLAIHGLNVDAADGNFLVLPELAVTGRQYFKPPTPQGSNGSGYRGFVKDTSFSVDRGFYTDPFTVTITTGTPGAVIYYTLDGSEPYLDLDGEDPDQTHGIKYTGPLTISGTTMVRAAAFREDWYPTNIDTHTYLFTADVIRQSPNGEAPSGWPSGSVAGQVLVYGMDPNIVNDSVWGPQMEAALTAIPTLSMVTDLENLLGASTGIYSHPSGDGALWERPTSLELIYPPNASGAGFPDGADDGFQIDAGVRIRGGYSRTTTNPKHAFRFFFRREYGDAKLNYPLFGDEGADQFDKVDLRTSQNYSWAFGGPANNTMVREVTARDLQGETGNPYTRSRYYHLYMNGVYWGIYMTQERSEAEYAATYLGGQPEDYDVIHQDDSRQIFATDGNTSAYYRLRTATLAGYESNVNYFRVQGMNPDGTRNPAYERLLDVENLIDYMLVTFYVSDNDGPGSHFTRPRPNNYWAAINREEPDGFKFFAHDMEHSYGLGTGNTNNMVTPLLSAESGTVQNFNAHWLHQELTANAEYRQQFADRVYECFYNGGIMSAAATTSRVEHRAEQIDVAIIAESARWGDTRTEPPMNRNHWVANVNTVRSWLVNRNAIVVNQLKSVGWYPDTPTPALSHYGGEVAAGFEFSMSSSVGTIYYALDGSDPRAIGDGVATGASTWDGNPITLNETTLVKARVLHGGQWSPLAKAEFLIGHWASAETLAVTELNYAPYAPTPEEVDAGFSDGQEFEFIELANVSDLTIDLTQAALIAGIDFTFTDAAAAQTPGALKLDPGERVVVVRNAQAFAMRYGTGEIPIAGQYDGKLKNEGEEIALVDRFGGTIVRFAYDNSGNWPGRAEGGGSSLELIDPAAVPQIDPDRTDYLQDGDNWRSSSEYGGSPGAAGEGPRGDVLVNEVLTHTDLPSTDTIELINTTGQAIDLGGWYLSDSSAEYRKFRIPDGTTIPAGGYVVFDEDDFNPSPLTPGPNDFALDGAHGDDVWLLEADAAGRLRRFVDRVQFGAAGNGESLGRWPNGSGALYPMVEPTFDPAHGENSGPRVGPVLISEVMYNAGEFVGAEDLEFVEICNPTAASFNLTNWRIRGGIDYDFPAGTQLGPHAVLVVVPFNPGDALKLAAFRDYYGIGEEIAILGNYSGVLDNGGERITLQDPDEPPLDEPDFIPRLLEDEVRYDDQAPWPLEADGTGHSLTRISDKSWGYDAASWMAASPTPGSVLPTEDAQVVGRYVFYNQSSYDGDNPAADTADDNAVAIDKVALLPGETATFANYTSYNQGINGLMIDVVGLPDGAALGTADFQFRTGNTDDPAGWPQAPLPTAIAVRPGDGVGSSDRITLLWNDQAVAKQWLQVTVLATSNTGLADPDVFYFGNAVGEAGNSTADAKVNASDMLLARNNPRTFLNPAPIDFPYDYNRDARVNATDMLIARNNPTHFLNALRLITIPGDPAAVIDAVAGKAASAKSKDHQPLSGVEAWQYELDQIFAQPRSTDKTTPAGQDVDAWLVQSAGED
ncbi:MAG: lamin tail domain-containing protein [Pirellulales bacterium]|nr:lamin tail domain-containing protein [Pirellulales bacterium]